MKTKFIVLEGGEGSGKSTLIEIAKKEFGDAFVYTREPGGSTYAETIRNIALKDVGAKYASSETQFALMWAARHDNLHKTMKVIFIDANRSLEDVEKEFIKLLEKHCQL